MSEKDLPPGQNPEPSRTTSRPKWVPGLLELDPLPIRTVLPYGCLLILAFTDAGTIPSFFALVWVCRSLGPADESG